MKLSVVMPAHNEEGCIEQTIRDLYQVLSKEHPDHEIVAVNDHSTDSTLSILETLSRDIPTLVCVSNKAPGGFGFAVRCGLENFSGDAVCVYMADASDRPEDLVRYLRVMKKNNCDCVFGSRFMTASQVIDYPRIKMVLNRFANLFIQMLFGLRYNDVTNAFKLYKKEVILGLKPFMSHHFNLTVELPLKAIVRGYSYEVISIDWINRKSGESKLKIKEMGSRYLFIVLYCAIEKWLSRGDYHRKTQKQQPVISTQPAPEGKQN